MSNHTFGFKNPISAEVVRPDGTIEVLPLVFNDVVDEGFEYLLGTGFRNQAVLPNWYLGLITSEGVSTPVLDALDTMGSHAWSETVAYDEAARVQWSPAVVTAKSIANSAPMVFTFNASVEIRGIFITSGNAKAGVAGTLWATALFNDNVAFTNSAIIRLIYTVSTSV